LYGDVGKVGEQQDQQKWSCGIYPWCKSV